MKLLKRMKGPTPRFFQKVRNAGLILVAVGTTILTAPVALPLFLVKAAGYITVAGGVASAVSQAATESETQKSKAHG